MLQSVVVHRGYHDVDDLPGRPLENTLPAFQQAWRFFTFAECDIVASHDGVLYLCHDETFQRLAEENSNKPELVKSSVCTLHSMEIDQILLRDGTRPSRLIQVLECAKQMNKQLVVEIKHDVNVDLLTTNLQKLMLERTDLAKHVAVIMSFHLPTMQRLAKWKQENNNFTSIKLMILQSNADLAVQRDFVLYAVDLVSSNQLDGIYFQIHEDMLQGERARHLQAVCAQVPFVGIWNSSKAQPELDGLRTCEALLKLGVTFVNSDTPEDELILLGLQHYNHSKSERNMMSSQWYLNDFCCW